MGLSTAIRSLGPISHKFRRWIAQSMQNTENPQNKMMTDDDGHYTMICEDDSDDIPVWGDEYCDEDDEEEEDDDDDGTEDESDPFATLPYIGDILQPKPQSLRSSLKDEEFFTFTAQDDDSDIDDEGSDEENSDQTERMGQTNKTSVLSRVKDFFGIFQPSKKKQTESESPVRGSNSFDDVLSLNVQEEEDDNDTDLGPEDAGHPDQWTCIHCTYVNDNETHICGVCAKTKAILLIEKENRQTQSEEEPVAETSTKTQELSKTDQEKNRKIRRIQAQFNLDMKSKAEMILQLTSEGYEEEDALDAIKKCKNLDTARFFIHEIIEAKEQNQKIIRKLLGESKVKDRARGEIAIQMMQRGCDEEMALELAEEYDRLEDALQIFNYVQVMQNDKVKKQQVDKLLENDKVTTTIKAVLAQQLIEMGVEEEDAVWAMGHCSRLEDAIVFLNSVCPICCEHFPPTEAFAMHTCTDKFCQQCAKNYFSAVIKDHIGILDANCPICRYPNFEDAENDYMEYFNFLGNMLKPILEEEDYELFQTKLRDRNMEKDPSFRWCPKCCNGFFIDDGGRKITCPNCQHATCSQCRHEWKSQHDGSTCEAYAKWCEDNKTETQTDFISKLLNESGIDCPSCKARFELAKGGCMHFTCPQCKHEFCSGCNQPFLKSDECNFSADCNSKGLHAHHSRRCLYYLRDKSPEALQKVLQETNVEYKTENLIENLAEHRLCPVMEQKETPDGMKDENCGKEVEEHHGGLCRKHYTEYLVGLINKHGVDPVHVYDIGELTAELRRNNKQVPVQTPQESEEAYRKKMIEVIRRDIALPGTVN